MLPDDTLMHTLAAAIHEHYRAQAKREGRMMRHDVPFEDLSFDLQHANLAAARRIPSVLAVAGLQVDSTLEPKEPLSMKEVLAVLEQRMEAVAEAEHCGWMQEKLESGWRYGAIRDDDAKIHPCLLPYDELSEPEKEKDRSAVRHYPEIIRRAGLWAQTRSVNGL